MKSSYELTNKEHVPGVTVAIIRNGELAWTQGIGYADLENKRLFTTKTIFNIGSVSKVVSAWVFMQLSERIG